MRSTVRIDDAAKALLPVLLLAFPEAAAEEFRASFLGFCDR